MTQFDLPGSPGGARHTARLEAGASAASDVSFDPRTGGTNGAIAHTSAAQVEQVVTAAGAVAERFAQTSPAERREMLRAVADAVDASAAELVWLADRETGLGETRLKSEVARLASQLRFYADVCAEGSWLRATLDEAGDASSSLARVQVPLGPVAVFGASNFPFAFGVLGNDTASALAAGCPVVAKAHPAHPMLSVRLGEIATSALASAGAAAGVFDVVVGFEAGKQLVLDPHVRAVGFTGSQNGGLALWRLANERREVIPVFAEMGTVNPVVVTTDAAAEPGRVATGFVSSMTLGAGQFCTKPGLLLAPEGAGLADALGAAVSATQIHPMLTAAMAAGVSRGVEAYEAAGGQVIGTGSGASAGWSAAPTVVHVPAELFTRESVFAEECFGPVGLVVEYTDRAHLESLLAQLQGSLVATVASSGPHDPETADLVALLARSVGRVTVDDWPTGVAWTWAQQHGGPWPATSAPASTSVGAAALDRFTRPVTFQNLPDSALPPALRHDNPWGLPRRINGRMN